jgi:hypothetical protein
MESFGYVELILDKLTIGGYSWSVVVTGPTIRKWANRDCRTHEVVA